MASIAGKLTHGDVLKIVRLIESLHRSKLEFIRLEVNGVEILISKGAVALPNAESAQGVLVAASHVGIFRTGSRGVRIGSRVDASSALGTVHTLDEVNEVKAGVSGEVVEDSVRDGDFVEYGQPLYRIVPTSA